MNFYSAIATHYDSIFPLNTKQLSFITKHCPIENFPRLIEIGSARGVLTKACSDKGYQVRGLELDHTMVTLAQFQYKDISFYCDNMLNIEDLFPKHSCDAMVCFGNTLVHLPTLDMMSSFLKAAYKTIKPGGKLLIQFINYDRIIDQNIDALPTISNEAITFVRDYELVNDTQLLFKATLSVHADNMTSENTQSLYPLRNLDFSAMAQEVGFQTMAYGNFNSDDWTADSMQSIFVCQK